MHDPREALSAALRDYSQWAHGRPGQQHLLERMEEMRVEVEQLPSPMSQGPGSVPTTKPGSSGARGEEPTVEVSVPKQALAILQAGHSDGA